MVLERLWWRVTHKEGELALHPIVGLVLREGDADKFPHALGFERLDPFSGSASRVRVTQP